MSTMLDMFQEIYRNQYYGQEAWKICMHLTEELGEATIELSRLELAWRGHARNFDIGGALAKVYRYTDNKIDKEIRRMEESKAPESAIASAKLT